MELFDFVLVTTVSTLSAITLSSLTVIPLYSDDYKDIVDTLAKFKLTIGWSTPVVMFFLCLLGYFVMLKIDTWTALFVIVLTLIALIDFKFMLIPNRFMLLSLITVALMVYYSPYISIYELGNRLLVAVGVFFVTYLIAVITGGKLGGSDVKILTILAFAFDFSEYLVLMCVMSVLGLIVSVLCLIFRNNKPFPLMPFIHIGVITALFFGDYLVNKYLEVQLY